VLFGPHIVNLIYVEELSGGWRFHLSGREIESSHIDKRPELREPDSTRFLVTLLRLPEPIVDI
jgi:hypothetical protein